MKSITFKIQGMHCDACANTIKSLVQREQGVQMAAVSFEEGEARILYDPTLIDEARLIAAIQMPGFRVVQKSAGQERVS